MEFIAINNKIFFSELILYTDTFSRRTFNLSHILVKIDV